MSKLPRPLKHPRNDFESDSDFEDMPKHKARRVCQPQRFVAVSEADVDASKKPIVVKNTESNSVGYWSLHVVDRRAKQAKQGAMSNGSALLQRQCGRALPLDIAPRFARFALRSMT